MLRNTTIEYATAQVEVEIYSVCYCRGCEASAQLCRPGPGQRWLADRRLLCASSQQGTVCLRRRLLRSRILRFSLRNPLSQRHLEMSAVARFGTSEISVQARFRVRTFFRCAQVKNCFGLECPVSMVVVQPQDLSNWHAKGFTYCLNRRYFAVMQVIPYGDS
eukprot:COSAG05_NODE_350_length_10922_cov_2274.791370_6_plen_162_part_00